MKFSQIVNYSIRIIIPTACLFLGVWGYVLFERTIIPWWIPVVAATVFGIFLSPFLLPLSKMITTSQERWVNIMCSLAMADTLCYFALLGSNYWLADTGTAHKEDVTVVEKIKEQHNKYRRSGRGRVISTGEYYYNYFYVVKFSDGTLKKTPANPKSYHRTRTNSTITLNIQKGALGIDVIR